MYFLLQPGALFFALAKYLFFLCPSGRPANSLLALKFFQGFHIRRQTQTQTYAHTGNLRGPSLSLFFHLSGQGLCSTE